MKSPVFTDLKYTYKKVGSDVWVLNNKDIPVDWDLIKDTQIVHLAPKSVGGNHKHPRTEWFIGIGDLSIVWNDESGVRHEEEMYPKGQIKLVKVPSMLPHAVINRSSDKFAVLYELSDDEMKEVESVKIV